MSDITHRSIEGIQDQGSAERFIDALEKSFKQETGKDCKTCTHQEEVDGEFCYECAKGYDNNYEKRGQSLMAKLDKVIENNSGDIEKCDDL